MKEDPDFRRELSDVLGLTAFSQLKEATEQLSKVVVQSRDLAVRLEGVVERLVQRVDQLTQRVDQLAVRMDQLAEAQRKTEEELKLLAEAQRKTEERLNQLTQRVDQLAVRMDQLADAQRKTEERLNQLTQRVDQLAEAQRKTEEELKLLAEAQRKLEEFLLATRKEFSERFDRLENKIGMLDKTISSLGQRWGVSYEELIREFFKEIVESEGINLDFINRFTYKDQQGNFGAKGTRYEVDIYAKDDKVYLMEVKSFAEGDDVEWFNTKCDVLTRVLGLKNPIKLFLAVTAREDAVESSKAHGVKLIYGNLVEEPKRSKGKSEEDLSA
ncbi:hypothetical protein GCM10007116_07660 [Sulfodiicoccus acidiphilus]|uniref:DUF3782 domain-containing protein n=1 Tax=Sulfodiicoccus acidiphilus TaxID=1670455 RepID=A0A830GY18_9CREN|nr:hypothetical protein GCM10007116_07660 [Sulfodiicoccus acidiphilus]